MVRVFKSRYYRRSFFFECGIGFRLFFVWRSFMFGRELLKEGLVRDVGDGKDTNVWCEKWIIEGVFKILVYR